MALVTLSCLLMNVHGTCSVSTKANTCITGLGYARFENITTVDACCAKCEELNACIGFEVRIDLDPAQCVLKNVTMRQIPSKLCAFSAFLGPAPGPSPGPAPVRPTPAPQTALAFNDMFKGGAVLQRGQYVAVWGVSEEKEVGLKLLASGGSEVSVSAKVNSSGIWMVHLPPQQAAFNRTLTVTDSSGSQHEVVSFGETVLCAGQSNMGMQVGTHSPSSYSLPSYSLPSYSSSSYGVTCFTLGMQVGPSRRGFDADNATAESTASIRYTGKISLHSRVSRWVAAKGTSIDSTTW
jgi:hypothetical protein